MAWRVKPYRVEGWGRIIAMTINPTENKTEKRLL
jgi:hypothetical protein